MSFQSLQAMGDSAVRQTLGETVTYSPGSGSPVSVHGVFDKSYVLVDNSQAGVSSKTPALFLTLSDLPTDPTTDITAIITVGASVYRIREAQPDGVGGTLLLLHRVS